MANSDDEYFSGADWMLDEKTTALFDEQESKFRSTQTQKNTVGPPAKRQKTTTGSLQPQPAGNRAIRHANTMEDLEDLPDVSIRQDGTYGLQDKPRPSGPPNRPVIAPRSNSAEQARPVARSTTIAPAALSRGPAPPIRSTSVVPPVRAAQAPSRTSSSAHGSRSTQSPVSSQEVTRPQYGAPQRVARVASISAPAGYVEQLIQQIEELRKKNETMQTEMESALEAKFSKQGEVTILRKRLEKTTQDHLVQLAKLKATKDEADAKHVQIQKQYEAEKERLKTELTFRRHEIETSSRKHVLPRNNASQATEPFNSQRQTSMQWSPRRPPRLAPETPRRPRFGDISEFDKLKKPTALETRDLPSGFHTGPPRWQPSQGRKGERTAAFNESHASSVIPIASPVPQESNDRSRPTEVFASQMDEGGPMEDFMPQADIAANDVYMMEEGAGTPVLTLSSQENTTVLALQSWNLILHGIMLTHTQQGSQLPTLQLLVSASPVDTGQVRSYGSALMRIFDIIGGIPAHSDWDFEHVASTICFALCDITDLLAKNDSVSPLTAVLNLLTNLIYMLPSIHIFLLSQRVPEQNETPRLLGVLNNLIQNQLQKLDVTTRNEPAELRSLGKETLSLYEALVWGMPDGLEDALSGCPGILSLLTTLLHPQRPVWFLIESMRILLWLSTRRNLCHSILSHSATQWMENDGGLVHHPQIALACSLLTDTERREPEADELKSLIIMFFGMLSSSHPDVYATLVDSQELIPSVVLYLHHLVTPIWDGNEVIFNDPHALTRKVHIIHHTTLLLHHLATGENTTLDLGDRLFRAPAKTYQGLIHLFILTLGRLSYAKPPYWLDDKDRKCLGEITNPARTLLEKVIQGPELDSIWATYQDEAENSEVAMDVDDEEVEAQKIADS